MSTAELEVKVISDRTPYFQRAIREAVKDAITKACLDVEAFAKTDVPVDTGNLENSIQADLEHVDAYEGTVGTSVEYASYVEYGTGKMPARPYLTPAAERVGASFVEVVARLVNSRLKD